MARRFRDHYLGPITYDPSGVCASAPHGGCRGFIQKKTSFHHFLVLVIDPALAFAIALPLALGFALALALALVFLNIALCFLNIALYIIALNVALDNIILKVECA